MALSDASSAEASIAWDSNLKVKFTVPFQTRSSHPIHLYLDKILPRLVVVAEGRFSRLIILLTLPYWPLSEFFSSFHFVHRHQFSLFLTLNRHLPCLGSTDRQTKVAACELLHSVLLIMIGTNSSTSGTTPVEFQKLYDRLFPGTPFFSILPKTTPL